MARARARVRANCVSKMPDFHYSISFIMKTKGEEDKSRKGFSLLHVSVLRLPLGTCYNQTILDATSYIEL